MRIRAHWVAIPALAVLAGATAGAEDAGPPIAPTPAGQHRMLTEAAARTMIEAYGYRQVGALRRDAELVWRGHAERYGKSAAVSIDANGNFSDR